MKLRRLQARLGLACWMVSAVCVLYLLWRYDNRSLGESSCSPLVRFAAGSTLLVDRRPPQLGVGDALLFRGLDGRLHLGVVERRDGEADRFWVGTDNPACPGPGSEGLGWIERRDCAGRVLFAWPW